MTNKEIYSEIISRIEQGETFSDIIFKLGYGYAEINQMFTKKEIQKIRQSADTFQRLNKNNHSSKFAIKEVQKRQGKQAQEHFNNLPFQDRKIIEYLANQYGFNPIIVLMHSRIREIVQLRQMAQYVFVKCYGYTLISTGTKLCIMPQDHTTVLHGVKTAESLAHNYDNFNLILTEACRLANKNKPETIHFAYPKLISFGKQSYARC